MIDWFEYDDGGRSTSRRSRQRSDCAVVAYAIVTGQPYDTVYDRFRRGGRRSGAGTEKGFTDALFRIERFEMVTFPAVAGHDRMHPAEFGAAHPDGRWVVSTARHMSAVVDGVWRDEFRPYDDRCIYRAWRLPDDWSPAT